MLLDRIIIGLIAAALALFPPLASAQSVIGSFPPGVFQSRAAIDGTPPSGHPMVTPVMWENGGVPPSNTALNYTGFPGGTFSATQAARQAIIASNFTVSGLQARFPTAAGAGATWNICLVKNGVSTCTALACQITNAAVGCADATDTVSVSASDLLALGNCPSNASGCPAGSLQLLRRASANLGGSTSATNGESALFSTVGLTGASAAAQNFASWGSNISWNATEGSVSAVMPTAGIIDRLYFSTNTAPGAAKSIQLQVYHNGAASTINCSLTGTGTGAGITTCDDLTDSVTVAAGDTLSLSSTPTGTPSIGTATASVRFQYQLSPAKR